MSATRPSLSAPSEARAPGERLDTFYREFAPKLVWIVASELRRPPAEVEDACQQAWATLARRVDVLDGEAPRSWLVTVARHAYFAEMRGRPIPVERLPELTALPLEDVLDARAALRQVAALRPVRKRVFERHLAGLSYEEIMAELGVSYTNVNRQVTESRAELRAAA